MNDSADIKMAADRLRDSLRTLESALDPLMEKINVLEKQALEAGDFETDRAALARELDQTASREAELKEREAEYKARDAAYKEREKEFAALAEETTQELDRVIRQVQDALGQDDTSGEG